MARIGAAATPDDLDAAFEPLRRFSGKRPRLDVCRAGARCGIERADLGIDADRTLPGSDQSFAIGNRICLYPNPNSGKFNIDVTEPDSKMKFEIINSLGQTIYSNFLKNEKNPFDINLIKGIYHVRININNYSYGQIMIVRD